MKPQKPTDKDTKPNRLGAHAIVNWKRPFILSSSLLVLGSFAYWLEYGFKPSREEKLESGKRVFQIKREAIAGIRISDGKKVVSLRCLDLDRKLCRPTDTSKWEITEPVRGRADDTNVNQLLGSLSSVISSDVVDLSEDTEPKRKRLLQDYKLDEALRKQTRAKRVEVELKNGDVQIAYIGDIHPVGDTIFVGVGRGKVKDEKLEVKAFTEKQVYLIPTFFMTTIEKDLTYWRDKKLFSFGSHELNQMTLNTAKGKIQAKRVDGNWMITTPKGDLPAETEEIDGMLNAVAYLTATQFISEKRTDARAQSLLRQAKRIASIELHKAQPAVVPSPSGDVTPPAIPTPLTLQLYQRGTGKTAKLYALASTLDAVVEIDPSLADRVQKGLGDLRLHKLVTPIDRFTFRSIQISGHSFGGALQLKQTSGGDWEAEGHKIDQARVSALLEKLTGNRIRKFLTLAEAGPAPKNDSIEVIFGDEKEPNLRTLVFFKKGEQLFARDKKEAYLLDPTLITGLPWKVVDLDEKTGAPQEAASGSGKQSEQNHSN